MSTNTMWTSKLGNKYPMAWMQQNDQSSQKELKGLRALKSNSLCADCGRQDNSWASVSHGVFVCVICSDVHRSVGTHISKVKGCTGTYLWGPDELERMQTIGNRGGDETYGAERIDPGASKEQKQRYVAEKYEKRSFASKSIGAQPKPEALIPRAEERTQAVRKAEQAVRNSETLVATMPRAQVKPNSAGPIAGETNIPDTLFDELFNEAEDSYFGNASAPLKVSADSNLDAFLNTTLSVSTQPKAAAVAGYPISLDPFHNIQPESVPDPFADWPTF